MERIVDFTKDKPHIQIVLGSLMPCPETDNFSKPIFKDFNSRLFQLAESQPNVFFLNIAKEFLVTKKHPRPHNKANEKLFKRDKIHTNFDGAEVLAELIFKKVYHLPMK